jgi:DNA-binding transcriptional regulator YbjK
MKKPFNSIQESLQKAWSDALASLHGVEEEMGRRFRQLKERADLQQSTDEVQRILVEMRQRLQDSSEAFGQQLEERMRTVFSRVKSPLAEEVARLKAKAEQLGRRIESQLGGKAEAPEAAKPAEESESAETPKSSGPGEPTT